MYTLHIANKNYSSWSLRPWILMKELGIPFQEVMHPFGAEADWEAYKKSTNPSGLVPCLVEEGRPVWDSLAIIEYLAEKHDGVWPSGLAARSWSRSVVAEMHSGFSALRTICSMNCGLRVALKESMLKELSKDITRIDEIWQQGLEEFGGPFLSGSAFSAVDAFYAPVVSRFQTYGIDGLSDRSLSYIERVLQNGSMADWYEQALNEPYRDEAHESEVSQFGNITADYRKA